MRDYFDHRPRHTVQLEEWHVTAAKEEVLEPALPIVDAHHHLYGDLGDDHHYNLSQLTNDLSSGHSVIGTIYVEAYASGWRTDGPEEQKPIGEVELISTLTRDPLILHHGTCQAAAGIVSFVDLSRGTAARDVIEAQIIAANGKLRGVRHAVANNSGLVGRTIPNMPKPYLLADSKFRDGIAELARLNLTFEVWCYHYQLPEVCSLADAFPELKIVINHLGGVIGVAEFRSMQMRVRAEWNDHMRDLSRRPNVTMKIGGLGMPVFGFGFEYGKQPASSHALAAEWRPFFDVCIETFGPSRCMLESNFPVDKQSCSYVALWNAFKMLSQRLSTEERRDLFYRSACRVYQLPDLMVAGDSR
ncbi:amidohydrolase family protein [Paraburkholderia youngii]|uniref:amidohydrolase family protein n=1 Tax=Paraburkholderia youngii TaxID=2782701 RepID=UPI003D1D569C